LSTAYAKLHGTVRRAFDHGPEYPRTPFNERERYAAAVAAVAQLFSTLGDRPVGNRFFNLASAISDLNSGTVHPLLQAVRTVNRRPDFSQLWRARARVALGLEALIRSGAKVDATVAAEKVAKRFPLLAKLAGPKASQSRLAAVLLGWRREFRATRIKNFEATELFLEGMRRIEHLTAQPARLREFSADQLTEAIGEARVLSPSS
jgi:hypothetical protein